MSQNSLKKTTQDIINPTGRMDIAPGLVIYEAQIVSGVLHYRLTVRNWARVLGRLKGRETLVVDFRVDNGPKLRSDVLRAAEPLKRGGEVKGQIALGADVDPLSVSATLLITDPGDNHRIVVRAHKAKADVVADDLAADVPENQKRVNPFKQTRADALSIIDMRVSPAANGKFSMLLENVDVPTLLISPQVGKKAFLADLRIQSFALGSLVREVLTALAFHTEEYEGEVWFPLWKDFAATLSETGEFDHFIDEDIDYRERRDRVEGAVAAFDARHFSQVSFDLPVNDIHEE
jgi:hypothetical protein